VSDPDWLARACAELLRSPAAREAAVRLGSDAADADLDLRTLVAGILDAARAHWAEDPVDSAAAVHERATKLFRDAAAALTAAMDGYHQRTRGEVARYATDRASLVDDLLAGAADPAGLAERAQRYGVRLSASHAVLVARADGLTASVVRRVDSALAARYGEGNILTALRGNHLVCVSTGGLRGVPAELAHHLAAALGPGSWQIGVGRDHRGMPGIATSLDEARNALDLADKLGYTTPVLQAADLLVFPVLLRDRDAITDLVTTVLGPLAHARGGPRPYLDTLSVLFDNQGNYTATARQMHLSVRAVTYRLDRIRTLTGYHPGEPTQRLTLHTAVLGARLLGWPTA
jgi:sugar diacid utilization regulator